MKEFKLTEDDIVKAFFDFIVDGGNHGGLSGLEADLYNMPVMKQILENQRLRELVEEKTKYFKKLRDDYDEKGEDTNSHEAHLLWYWFATTLDEAKK